MKMSEITLYNDDCFKRLKKFEPKKYQPNNEKMLKIIEEFIDNI